jgi:hypothetical protein
MLGGRHGRLRPRDHSPFVGTKIAGLTEDEWTLIEP